MSGDMEGRVCIVTGANTGIGRVTAHELARRGAHVVLACRTEKKTRPVIDEIQADTGNDRVDYLHLDLASFASVRMAADEFLKRDLPLHVLVNNAGLAGQRGTTSDGFEIAFGTNHLGHFLFTKLLLEKLAASAPSRVVVVASKSHYRAQGIDFEAVRKPTRSVTGLSEYEVSKLANVLHTTELARRTKGSGVTTYSLHPGVIATDVWRRVPWPVRPIMNAFLKSPDKGAKTTLFCATAPEIQDESGLYYDTCKQRTPSQPAQDPQLAQQLWDRSEQWCA